MRKEKIYNYTVKFIDNGEGGYIADVPAFPEICTEGWTLAEAEKNAKEAISLCLKVRKKYGEPIPNDIAHKSVKLPKFFKLKIAA